jgi:predicted small lipoprotein YifL
MKFFFRTTWLICLIAMLCACGQKGKLVMPVKPPPVSTPYPTGQPKDDESNVDTAPAKSDVREIGPTQVAPADSKPAEEKN